MIKITNLSKAFGELEVLKDISLQIADQETVVILGPSGSGKSTLLRCLNGLEELTEGSIEVSGLVVDAKDSLKKRKKIIQKIRRNTGMVFQQYNLYPHKTALENVMEALIVVKKMDKREARLKSEEMLGKVGLLDRKDFYPSKLSGGQQQRVAIARALAMEPDVLFFDEPTSALDPELVGEVLRVMRTLAREGMTMIVVTHEMKFAQDVADRVIFMADGCIEEDTKSEVFFSQPSSERAKKFIKQITEHVHGE
ncbi:ATP-binding cassette domain-containing protein [Terrilactibacillus sp. BCM23-1]|uniref:ATP-binding cassette domain-containing protein n=1 Tax=Terrilactibacillus tamarindi TaxID=2599694 RepID=A0A6N8CMT5_9BACI|nr:amino acid ABC transporter ATP-binding protein [Terrilactibacillus tamarindi]MTT31404.1 ATP-binding cassette domain-containing protein [Terrilactibacillus tamarindi]